jgi:hypothetical protein
VGHGALSVELRTECTEDSLIRFAAGDTSVTDEEALAARATHPACAGVLRKEREGAVANVPALGDGLLETRLCLGTRRHEQMTARE